MVFLMLLISFRNTERLLANSQECSSSRVWKENGMAIMEKDVLSESKTTKCLIWWDLSRHHPIPDCFNKFFFYKSQCWNYVPGYWKICCTLEMGSVHFNFCSVSLHTAIDTIFIIFFLTGPSVLLLLEIAWLRLVAEKKYHEIRLYLIEVTADLPVRLMLMVINPCVQWKLLAMGRSVVQKLQSKQRILWWNLSQFLLPFLWEIQGFFLGNTEYIPLHLFYFFWS